MTDATCDAGVAIVTFVLLVVVVVTLTTTALLARLLGAWPLATVDSGRARWRALVACAALTTYSLGLCLAIERWNRRCGDVLPVPYNPKGCAALA